jgi:hypothetical protein
MGIIENMSPVRKATIIVLLVLGFASIENAEGQLPFKRMEVCLDDTFQIPFNIPSFFEKEFDRYEATSYKLDYRFDGNNCRYIGIDYNNSVIPRKELDISLSVHSEEHNIMRIIVKADFEDQVLTMATIGDTPIMTLMFFAEHELNSAHIGEVTFRGNNTGVGGDYFVQFDSVYVFNNTVEINEIPALENSDLIVSATVGYDDYKWTYEKFSDSDYSFGDLIYEGSTASFNGNGLYSVSAVDEHDCRLSDEKYIESGGAFAKGTVMADGKPYTEGTVAAYLKTGEGFVLEHQRNIENGAFLFPSTLSSGEYKFCAFPEESSGYQATYYGNKPTIENAFAINFSNYEGVVDLNISLLTEEKIKSKSASNTSDYDFQIYPNPVRDNLNIQISSNNIKSQGVLVIVSNINGEIFYRKKLWITCREAYLEIDSSSFPQGTYIVKIEGLSKLFLKK